MPWCENELCKKTDLKADEVEFDDEKKMVLCKPCFSAAFPNHVRDDDKLSYGVHLTNDDGLVLELRYGDLNFSYQAKLKDIKNYLRT